MVSFFRSLSTMKGRAILTVLAFFIATRTSFREGTMNISVYRPKYSKHANKYQECLNHVTNERLPSLIAKISQDPEENGLIPLVIDRPKEYMKGLDLNVFRGKRIAMLGDSTLFYLTKWLYPMINKFDDEGADDPKYETLTLRKASALVDKRAAKFGVQTSGFSTRPEKPLPIKTLDGTWIEWTGMAGPNPGKLEDKINAMFSKSEEMQPHIIVANMGMHWLHMCGMGPCPPNGNNVQRWINYKNDWLKQVYNVAVKVNASLLLFKTMNFICDEIRTGVWETYSSLYLSFDHKTIDECYLENIKFLDTHNITKAQIYEYCKYGQMTEIGVRYLNDQIFDFVREIHENQSNSRLTVGIYNDHDVEGCYSTTDAIHHHLNMVIRLRLLSNTIESYYECNSVERSILDI